MFGGCPGDRSLGLPGGLVGFMPQDICLYSEFTIRETFEYFGRLQKLPGAWDCHGGLEKEQTELLDLLDLPEPSRRVSDLSGGQKRRLSFAVALLHNPKLLILDEPTVGVDPVVRARIWSHLQSLTFAGRYFYFIECTLFEKKILPKIIIYHILEYLAVILTRKGFIRFTSEKVQPFLDCK